ncbi:transporter substrate-binding domain-containing protein [Microvirga sp. G4-2]|uniref:transporter substrate-binding domain-containing protein n=1 Tax=Microvirga sp. G4-2 TaxID=3434467 RepID=UPI004043DA91
MKTDLDNDLLKVLAPTGSLRVAIAVGSALSAVWTACDTETGEPRGPTVDLAKLMAERIGVPLTLVACASSGAIIETASSGAWDVSFTPVDAERKKLVDFGPNYFLGESTYMVPAGSSIINIEDVDREGVRIYGVENTATIRSARKSLTKTTAVGLSNLEDALEKFRNGGVDALALGKESLQSLLSRFPGARMLDGHFHAAGTAVAVPKGRPEALKVFSRIIEDLKSDGTIRKIFDAHGMETATVAPVGSRP